MEYKGKLYGKVANQYYPLFMTTDDVERLEEKVKSFEQEKLETYSYLSDSDRIVIEIDGKKSELNDKDSGLIRSLRAKPSAFRIQLLNLTIVELDAYLRDERVKIADSFRKMFATKCRSLETDELINWKDFLQACSELPDKITPNKLVKLIENGTLTMEFTMGLLDEILDTVKLS